MKNRIIGIVLAGLALSLAVTLAGCENPTGGGGSRHYTITFDADGGSEVAAISAKEGTAVPSPEDPVKAGSTFAGWFSKAGRSGELFSWPYPLTGDVTMYARWVGATDPLRWTLIFDSNGGSDVEAVHTYAASTVIAEPAPPWKEGFTFLGWYNTPNDTGWVKYSWPYTLTSDVTMHARWHDNNDPPIPQYTITFKSEGGSAVKPITADSGAAVSRPADPTRPGYTFSGWFSAASGGTLYPWPYTLTKNVTMYAHWSNPLIEKYTITFDSQGGSAVKPVTAAVRTQVAEPSEPTKSGYIFEGWFSAASGGTLYPWPYTLMEDVTMYARWEAFAHFVVFNADGGIPKTQTRKVESGASVGGDMPANPTRTNYDFGGWWTGQSGDGSVFTADTTVTANIVVWAKWVSIACTITFNGNGGTPETQTRIVESGSAVGTGNMPTNPTRTGCAFGGWYTEAAGGGTIFTADTEVTADITVYANWNRDPAFIVLDFEPEISSGQGWTFAGTVYTISSGANVTVTGTTTTRRIVVASGATAAITLENADIQLDGTAPLDVYNANVTLKLAGNNFLKVVKTSNWGRFAGIRAPAASVLTITSAAGDGSEEGGLEAQGAGNGGTGIGGMVDDYGSYGTGGEINIKGGTIKAVGTHNGAGIGGSGTTDTAYYDRGPGGKVTISGGRVTATSGNDSAGIGGGLGGSGGEVYITGGTVIASGRTGIGATLGVGAGGKIEISGGNVTARGNTQGDGAGLGWEGGAGGTITISGGTVTAEGRGIGIGGMTNGGTITITGGTVVAKGRDSAHKDIGGSTNAGIVTIKGGSVKAPNVLAPPLNDGGAPVYLNTLTVGSTPAIDTAITEGSIDNTPCTQDGVNGYGINDVKTDADGKVYFWLPANDSGSVSLTAGGGNYSKTYQRTASGNTETLN
jgi:uncharacterized repeat protein (TIGR02543 family)